PVRLRGNDESRRPRGHSAGGRDTPPRRGTETGDGTTGPRMFPNAVLSRTAGGGLAAVASRLRGRGRSSGVTYDDGRKEAGGHGNRAIPSDGPPGVPLSLASAPVAPRRARVPTRGPSEGVADGRPPGARGDGARRRNSVRPPVARPASREPCARHRIAMVRPSALPRLPRLPNGRGGPPGHPPGVGRARPGEGGPASPSIPERLLRSRGRGGRPRAR